jgi:drug/metabolite transporter (DMT)-like permease
VDGDVLTNMCTDDVPLVQLPAQATMLLDPTVAGALVFAVLGATVFCFTGMSYGSCKLKPSVSSSYITLQPMFVALISLVLFGTVLDSKEIAAGGVVVVGLYLSIIGNPSVDRAWQVGTVESLAFCVTVFVPPQLIH